MIKNFLYLCLIGSFCSCINNTKEDNITFENFKKPNVIAYIGTDTLSSETRAATEYQNKGVYFYVRIDGRIPELSNAIIGTDPDYINKFYPLKNNTSYRGIENTGLINFNYSYNIGTKNVPYYVYDPEGVKVINIQPSIESILSCDKSGKKLPTNYDNLHIIWYVAKYQSQDQTWHVDGVLTTKNVTNAETIPGFTTYEYGNNGSVETNLSINDLKFNGDSPASKLSIHIRDTTDVKVIIPTKAYLSGYFNLRPTYNNTFKIGNNTVTAFIKYDEDSIIIKTNGINKEIIKTCRELYNDGITFEFWNYYTNRNIVVENLDKATIYFTNPTKIYVNTILNNQDFNVKPVQDYYKTITEKGYIYKR